MTTTVLNIKISEVGNNIHNHNKYITTPEFSNVIVENFTARLKQPNLVTKTDFDKNLTSFNRKITSSTTKHLEVQKELNSLIANDYNFFVGKMYFTSNDGSQNTFVYQPTVDMLELKKSKGTNYVLS